MLGRIVTLVGLLGCATSSPEPTVDTSTFRLDESDGEFVLVSKDSGRNAVTREWLTIEAAHPVSDYVSINEYNHRVTAFEVAGGLIGLHLSSYAIQPSGSARAAAGRDVFLIYDRASAVLRPGLINLGLTKWRLRSEGCFAAAFTSFVIADIDGDRHMDVGVSRDEVSCPRTAVDGADVAGPAKYATHPMRWYTFVGDAWAENTTHLGAVPKRGQRRLPMIGLSKSPVEFVRERETE